MKLICKVLIGLSLLLAICFNGNAQKRDVVAADGVIEYHNRIPLQGASLRLLLSGKEIDKIITGETGEYHFDLEYNKEYVLEISKEGLITKKLKYNTTMPSKFKGGWWVGIPINLYEICDNADASVFDDPVAVIEFDERRKEYQANPDHDNLMRKRIRNFEDVNNACLDNNYQQLVSQADALFSQKKFREAKDLYAQADDQRPWEYHSADRLLELEDLIAESQASEQLYENLIEQGNNQVNQGSLVAAKNTFRRAALLKPEDDYPKKQIVAIDEKMASQAKSAAPDQYDIISKQADAAFDAGNLTLAETLYAKASEIKPQESYPKTKLAAISALKVRQEEEARQQKQQILAKQQVEKEFNEWLTKGENALDQNDAGNAVNAFEKAHELKPGDAYTKSRLQKANKLLAEQNEAIQESNDAYATLIREGDVLLGQGNYDEAKEKYTQAAALKPAETLPKQKLSQVSQALQDIAMQKQKQAQQEMAYRQAIEHGNEFLAGKSLHEARTAFLQALEIMPGDALANSKLKEVSTLEQQQKQLLAEEAKNKEYEDRLKLGNSLMVQNKLNEAKQVFQQALILKPGEAYPQAQINTINVKLDEIAAEKTQALAKEEAYKEIMAQAEQSLASREYQKARSEYNQALAYKPGDGMATQKIGHVNQLIENQKQQQQAAEAKEKEYKQWIDRGDQLLAAENIELAKQAYQQALNLKPGAVFPTEKLEQVNLALELKEQERLAQQERENNYNNIIVKADERYNSSDYVNAKVLYISALNIKPDENYPKARVKQIEELLDKIQASQKSPPKVAEVNEKPPLPELDFSDNTELELYLVKVVKQYPPGITHEVYKRKHSTTNRYIIIRENKANEFREIVYNWGSEHSINGKPCTVLYFRQQTKKRPDEYYKRVEK